VPGYKDYQKAEWQDREAFDNQAMSYALREMARQVQQRDRRSPLSKMTGDSCEGLLIKSI